jgi:hypothetical protein
VSLVSRKPSINHAGFFSVPSGLPAPDQQARSAAKPVARGLEAPRVVPSGPALDPPAGLEQVPRADFEATKAALQGVLRHVDGLLTPEALSLAASRKSPREQAFDGILKTGAAAGRLTPALEEKQAWVNHVRAHLQETLGLTLPEVTPVIDHTMNPLSAKCSAVSDAQGQKHYVLSFGTSDYAFMEATIAHEFGHAHLDALMAESTSLSGVYWQLNGQLNRLMKASDGDATFQLRASIREVEAQLDLTGSPLARFASPYDNFVLDSYHELYADFVACLAANNPDAMFEAEHVAQRDSGRVSEQWEQRRFSTQAATPAPESSFSHTILAAARAPLWQATQQARAAGIADSAILRQLERSIVASLDLHVQEARDTEFAHRADSFASELVGHFSAGLSRLSGQRELW